LLRPTYEVNAPRGRFDVLNPVGPPPQAPPSPPANGAHADPEQLAYERMWREQREELANMLARQMLELQDYGAWMRFDKFMIYSERDRRRFEWAYVGRVDPSPYEEFVRFEDEPSDEPRRISEAELRIWLAQFRQAAFEEAAGPIVRSISQKLVERGWDSETMTKRWAGGDSMAFVKAIAYELIDTQKDVFHICLGEVEVWRTRGSVYVVG
jgi:hypothetical protein